MIFTSVLTQHSNHTTDQVEHYRHQVIMSRQQDPKSDYSKQESVFPRTKTQDQYTEGIIYSHMLLI